MAASLSAFSAFSASHPPLVAAPRSGCCSRSLVSNTAASDQGRDQPRAAHARPRGGHRACRARTCDEPEGRSGRTASPSLRKEGKQLLDSERTGGFIISYSHWNSSMGAPLRAGMMSSVRPPRCVPCHRTRHQLPLSLLAEEEAPPLALLRAAAANRAARAPALLRLALAPSLQVDIEVVAL